MPGEGYAVSLEPARCRSFDDPVQQIMVRTDGAGRPAAGRSADQSCGARRLPGAEALWRVTIRCGDGIIGRSSSPVPREPKPRR